MYGIDPNKTENIWQWLSYRVAGGEDTYTAGCKVIDPC